MIAVIFELLVDPQQQEAYFARAGALAPELQDIDGFLSVERFESVSQPGKFLSLSFWRDEAAVQQWRRHPGHSAAQQAGRQGIFSDYRLRVATVLRDYGLHARGQTPDQ